MSIGPKSFHSLVIVFSLAAAAMLPIWPYARWGYTPSTLMVVLVLGLLALQRLARE
jgi:hypothetical protein